LGFSYSSSSAQLFQHPFPNQVRRPYAFGPGDFFDDLCFPSRKMNFDYGFAFKYRPSDLFELIFKVREIVRVPKQCEVLD